MWQQIDTLARPKSGSAARLFTPREWEIAKLVAGGASNKEIAQKLSITERTVKAHLTNVFEKLGYSSRVKLAIFTLSREVAGSDFGPIDGRAGSLIQEAPRSSPTERSNGRGATRYKGGAP